MDQRTNSNTTASPGSPRAHFRALRTRLAVAWVAVTAVLAMVAVIPPLAQAEFGVVPGTFKADAIADAGGTPFTQAAGHPYGGAASFRFNTHLESDGFFGEKPVPDADIRDIVAELPAGFVGDPTVAPTCDSNAKIITSAQQLTQACPAEAQVGVTAVTFPEIFGAGEETFFEPVYNIGPLPGDAATFAFSVAGVVVVIHATVRTGDDYGVTTTIPRISTQLRLLGASLTLWGTPASPVHTPERGQDCVENTYGGKHCNGGNVPSSAPVVPFLTNPANCAAPPAVTTLHIDSWQNIGDWKSYSVTAPPLVGCDAVDFSPTLQARPTTNVADSPSGLDVNLHVPQNEEPEGLAEANLRDTTVVLPPGLVVNPSAANGLGACTESQFGFTEMEGDIVHTTPHPGECPDASRLGSVVIETPVVDHPLKGSIYLAQPHANPFGSLLALYVTVDDPATGVVVKLAGKVEANPTNGQLTATFKQNPQLPFEDFHLNFFAGAGGSLRTPATCGQYSTTSSMTPWSAPDSGPPATPSDSWAIERGPHGACATSEAGRPNSPSFEAGTVTPLSGAHSPFVMKLAREDGSQELKGLNLTLPPGLTGKLAGIPYCSDAQIAQAQSRSKPKEGAIEQAHPSCPQASEVGTVTIGAGAGPNPYYAQGHAYLAGPYKGAPLSLAIVTPAVAGPFDLGTVVVRAALVVNPETAQISVKSDEIPYILEGIPLDLRSIVVKVDRSDLTLNPTNCEAQSITGSAVALGGSEALLSNRFQVGECGALPFNPKLSLRVFGKTNRNAKPRLRAVLTTKPGEANIARTQVNLPHSEFLEQAHIKTVCTRVQFNAGGGHGEQCPPGSIYGHARAITPLLDQPLEGPVYLRSSSNKLPDLVAALNGQVDIALAGKVDSGPNKGIRNTFEVVPDAPVSKFVLEMRGGKKGLLVNSENLCSKKAKRQAIVRFTGQNGKVTQYKPMVANQCGKSKSKHRKQAGHGQKRSLR
ncbi:MAG: hypothetical protein WA862_01095 [Solirubrobacterales bacterium]